MAEILTLSSAECQPFLSQIASVYRRAFAGPPYFESLGDALAFEGRLPYHTRWKGFKCVAARLGRGELLAGFAYGYTSLPDTWWHEQVREKLAPALAEEWLGSSSFEFVELAVAPEYQGRGLGGALHDALLEGLWQRRAVLSTPQQTTNALHLYRKRGWIDLMENFQFAGVSMIYRIMGKRLKD